MCSRRTHCPPAPPRTPRLRTRLLEPTIVAVDAYEIGPGGADGAVGQWIGPDVVLRLANLGTADVPVHRDDDSAAGGDGAIAVLTIIDENGAEVSRTVLTAGLSTPVSVDLVAPAGTTSLRMTTSGDPVRLAEPPIVVSARLSELKATSSSGARVASMQDQVRTGTVVP